MSDENLFEQVGGREGLVKLAEDLYTRVGEDPRIKNRLRERDVEAIKEYQVNLMDSLLNNADLPQPSLAQISEGLGITKHEVDVFVSLLENACGTINLTYSVTSNVVSLLTSLRKEVENK